jgi:hypothetical protein
MRTCVDLVNFQEGDRSTSSQRMVDSHMGSFNASISLLCTLRQNSLACLDKHGAERNVEVGGLACKLIRLLDNRINGPANVELLTAATSCTHL